MDKNIIKKIRIIEKWKPILKLAKIPFEDYFNMAILYDNQKLLMDEGYNDLEKRIFISMIRKIIYQSHFKNNELTMERHPIFKLLGFQSFMSPANVCIDKLMGIEPVAVRSTKMRAYLTFEALQDLQCHNKLDAECEISDILSEDITEELTKTIMDKISKHNVIKVPIITSNIIRDCANTMEIKPNWIILDAKKYGYPTEKHKPIKICESDSFHDEFKTYCYMEGLGNKVIMGYKNDDYDASVYFLPYILLGKTQCIDPDFFIPKQGTIMRYGLASFGKRILTLDANTTSSIPFDPNDIVDDFI